MASLRKCLSSVISHSYSYCRSQVISQSRFKPSNFIRPYGTTYEGDGKTHAVLLNTEGLGVMINSYSTLGFSLNNDISVIGPIALFPNCVLSWNVGDVTHIDEESLSLFLLMEPKLDILILGVSDYNNQSRKTLMTLAQLIRKYKIQVEVMSTEIACPTYNFLVAEQRFVGAGIIPPLDVRGSDTTSMDPKGTLGYVPKDR